MSIKRILKILKRMLVDKKFRNMVINRLTQEVRQVAKPVNIATQLATPEKELLKTLRIAFVGGCEISFLKE